jgi:hypothetical protein
MRGRRCRWRCRSEITARTGSKCASRHLGPEQRAWPLLFQKVPSLRAMLPTAWTNHACNLACAGSHDASLLPTVRITTTRTGSHLRRTSWWLMTVGLAGTWENLPNTPGVVPWPGEHARIGTAAGGQGSNSGPLIRRCVVLRGQTRFSRCSRTPSDSRRQYRPVPFWFSCGPCVFHVAVQVLAHMAGRTTCCALLRLRVRERRIKHRRTKQTPHGSRSGRRAVGLWLAKSKAAVISLIMSAFGIVGMRFLAGRRDFSEQIPIAKGVALPRSGMVSQRESSRQRRTGRRTDGLTLNLRTLAYCCPARRAMGATGRKSPGRAIGGIFGPCFCALALFVSRVRINRPYASLGRFDPLSHVWKPALRLLFPSLRSVWSESAPSSLLHPATSTPAIAIGSDRACSKVSAVFAAGKPDCSAARLSRDPPCMGFLLTVAQIPGLRSLRYSGASLHRVSSSHPQDPQITGMACSPTR